MGIHSGRVLRFIYLFHTLHLWEESDNQSLHKPGNAVRYWNCYCTFTVEAARPIRCRFEADSAPGRERAPVVQLISTGLMLLLSHWSPSIIRRRQRQHSQSSSESWIDYYTREHWGRSTSKWSKRCFLSLLNGACKTDTILSKTFPGKLISFVYNKRNVIEFRA